MRLVCRQLPEPGHYHAGRPVFHNRHVLRLRGVHGILLDGCHKKRTGRAEFDNKKVNAALKQKLSLKRDIVAMKFADKAPDGVRVEEGPTFWCAICGDIFEGQGDPVFFRGVASSCGGSKNVGIGSSKVAKEDFEMVINAQVVGEGNLYATKDLLAKNRAQFPRYPKVYGGMILGSLDRLSRPDIILIPVNCRQMSFLSALSL